MEGSKDLTGSLSGLSEGQMLKKEKAHLIWNGI